MLYHMPPKKSVLLMLLLSMAVSLGAFVYQYGGVPGNAASWGNAVGVAIQFMALPLIALGITQLIALLRKKPAPDITLLMFGLWAFMAFGHILGLNNN